MPAADLLHADVDAFYASVAQRDDPQLRGRPTIVGSGVVLAASYEARAFGVRGGMGGGQARRLCPRAAVVSPDWPAYVEASRAVFAVFHDTAPVVEGLSLEEAFLDVSGLERISGSPIEIAQRLRRDVRDRVGLPITVGVGRTRLVAKMASRAAKPDGLLVVSPEHERRFLDSLRVEELWGVGPATAAGLHRRGVMTVRQAAQLSEAALIEILGRGSGRRVHALVHNRSRRRVSARRGRRSIGAQHALGRSPKTADSVDIVVLALVDRVTRRMRSSGRVGRTVVLRLRFADFSRASRSETLSRATAETRTVLVVARGLVAAAWPTIERRGLTLVGITVTNLQRAGAEQLTLPVEHPDARALDAAVDRVRDRFGDASVSRAVEL